MAVRSRIASLTPPATAAIAAVTPAANTVPLFTGTTTATALSVTPAAQSVLDDTTVGGMVSTLGAQPVAANLTAIAGLSGAANKIPVGTGSGYTEATASATSAAGVLIKADAGGKIAATFGGSASTVAPLNASAKIDSTYGGSASTIATLDSGSKVVEDPANATATPTANKIVVADANGKVNGWVTSYTFCRSEIPIIPGSTIYVRHFPRTGTKINRIALYANTQPATAGTYTLAVTKVLVGVGTKNMLSAATYDLESLAADTLTELGLTATTQDLEFTTGNILLFTLISDNGDLTGGAGMVLQVDFVPA